MYFIEEFDLKENVSIEEFLPAWNALTEWWHTHVSTIRLVHFSARVFGLGPRPHYLAIWEHPDFASMDGWRKTLAADPHGMALEKAFSSMVTNVSAKEMVDLLDPKFKCR